MAKTGKQIDKPGAALQCITLPDASVEAWLMSLDAGAGHDLHCSDLLSRDELQRADHFHFERDRRRFMVTRGTLRMLLARELGITPTAIVFSYGKNGKPGIAEPAAQIHFSVSHSEERALIAISRSFRLGVDIEYLGRHIDCDGLARRFFTHRESATLQHLPATIRKREFLACWTRKEAVIKATGDGLSLPLDQFEVTAELDAAPRILMFAAATQRIPDWTLYAADVGSDYVATVAAYCGN